MNIRGMWQRLRMVALLKSIIRTKNVPVQTTQLVIMTKEVSSPINKGPVMTPVTGNQAYTQILLMCLTSQYVSYIKIYRFNTFVVP